MENTNHLMDEAAIEKMSSLAKEVDIAMFCTKLTNQPFNTCPMSTQGIDKDGTIWFFSAKDSEHNKDVEADSRVQVLYSSKVGENSHLSLYGKAEVTFDRSKAEELWSPHAKVWFPEGVDDPNLTLIRFTPESGYYWDTKSNKMVTMAKYAASVVTGSTYDDGVDGKLDL